MTVIIAALLFIFALILTGISTAVGGNDED